MCKKPEGKRTGGKSMLCYSNRHLKSQKPKVKSQKPNAKCGIFQLYSEFIKRVYLNKCICV